MYNKQISVGIYKLIIFTNASLQYDENENEMMVMYNNSNDYIIIDNDNAMSLIDIL